MMTSTPSENLLASTSSMPQYAEKQQAVPVRKIRALFFGSLSLIFLSMILGLFDSTTELFPAHDGIDQACLLVSGLFGLFACGTGIYLTRKLTIIQRVVLPLVFMFVTAVGIFLIAGQVSSILEGRVDFPADKSHKRQALLVIARAYQTHGKRSSQYIQTMPIWSNLEITRTDFAFMQDHRRPGDDGKNSDEISSRGYFCANVTIEQSDKALRILNAGSQKLPQGTVVVCPISDRVP